MSQSTPFDPSTSARPGLVLTAIGPDRPGLVNAIAGFVNRAGGNIEDTRMAKLGGEFAVLLLITGTAAALDELSRIQRTVESELGLSCSFRRTQAGQLRQSGLPYKLLVSASDRPGIVESVSEVLAARQINVASLSSRVVHAPLTGTPLFQLEAELDLPSSLNLAEFRRALEEACERENLDHTLTAGRG